MAGERSHQDPILPRKWFGFEYVSILDNKVPTIFWRRIRRNSRSCGAAVPKHQKMVLRDDEIQFHPPIPPKAFNAQAQLKSSPQAYR
jgi:hypothetical protein